MRKFIYWTIIAALAVVLVVYFVGYFQYKNLDKLQSKSTNYSQSNIASTDDSIAQYFDTELSYFKANSDNVFIDFNGNTIETNASIVDDFQIENNGIYEIYMAYKVLNSLNYGSVSLQIDQLQDNGTYKQLYVLEGRLNNYSTYKTLNFQFDRYGNEVVPEQNGYEELTVDKVLPADRLSAEPITIQLPKGNFRVSIKNNSSTLVIYNVIFARKGQLRTYADYLNEFEGKDSSSNQSEKVIMVDAEKPVTKSDFLINIGYVSSSSVRPFQVNKRRINAILESTFNLPGQKILWTFYVDNPGFYSISLNYKQSENKGVPVYRNIEIDGQSPFAELQDYPFDYTGQFWRLATLSLNGNPMKLWLEKGWHILSFEVDTGVYKSAILELQRILKQIQDIGISIRMLVGHNLDPNRTWNIEQYLPTVLVDLQNISDKLMTQYNLLIEKLGVGATGHISDLKVAASTIDKILKEPERLPFYLDSISEGDSSIAQRVSNLITALRSQPMGIDEIYIHPAGTTVDVPHGSFMVAGFVELEKLRLSLMNQTDPYSTYVKKSDSKSSELTVWVNRPVQLVETMQYLVDTDFYEKTGIDVRLSTMPSEQKVIFSAAAKTTPDVALGLSNWLPYELALRGAVTDLLQFPDFKEYISKDYNIQTLTPFIYEDGIYGVTETQGFYVLFYRKDIFQRLNLPVPQTWDDVKLILPELQRRGMNFYIPLSASSQKYFHVTAPFIFQNGGTLYSKDGMSTAINSEETLKGLELMTDLYSIYGVPEYVANFYNEFRYGRIPIGVADFGTYLLLTNAADEIYGLWDIAPSPGIYKDGEILRYQVASDRAGVIFKDSTKKEEAWEFLKWWLSKDTQVKFSNTLVSRYGPDYLWNTANISAFKEITFIPESHKSVILEQWRWIKEVQRHPASYMTEREISNVWNRVVLQGENLRVAVDKSIKIINREMERKLIEFGYLKGGKIVKKMQFRSIEDFFKEGEVK
ncbi:MAG TPA: extracellular solute-binding protein [Fervidobacterium sp.]|nr:extracellular solute-binding protein [Fervidobacterium sp.]